MVTLTIDEISKSPIKKGIIVKYLSEISTTPRPWLLLAFSALCFELCALYFQYSMELAPCIMCVYQRLAILGLFFGGLIGAIGCKFMVIRLLGYLIWGVSAIWGFLIAKEHFEIQSSDSLFYTCEYIPNFPTWMPLHQWMPWLFEATGDCGDISWQFLGYTMPQMMIIIFGVFTALFAFVLLSRLYYFRKL